MSSAVLAILGFLCLPAWGQQLLECRGSVPDLHPMGVFDFETNARKEPIAQGAYRFQVIPCVKNNDKDYPLQVRWLVPLVDGWVRAGEAHEFGPLWILGEQVHLLSSCIAYGNRGDTTHAKFLGGDDAKEKVRNEDANGCHRAIIKAQDRKSWIDDLFAKFRSYYPSNLKIPEKTMLQFDGSVQLKKLAEDR